MSNNRFIVITSIFPPTEAIRAFASREDYQLLVVGDKKTPANWESPGARYLSVGDQRQSGFRLTAALPYNHYCRKMVGYLQAMQEGAEVIVDTDDDNIPLEGWSFPKLEGELPTTPAGQGFFNVYSFFTSQKIWPRGLPLNLINQELPFKRDDLKMAPAKVGIWQGLANLDPDVDAIYRLVSNTPCTFDEADPFVLADGTYAPYNSQNTLYRRELFPLLYLPAHVTFRFTDILRGYIAQPIMNQKGYQLGFLNATVKQLRNPHDYIRDFESEIPAYLNAERVMELVISALRAGDSLADNLHAAYRALWTEGIVPDKEFGPLEAWLRDCEDLL